jgi:ABC-type dipeptide/oligopeptide/nickel transport system ATPase subunit
VHALKGVDFHVERAEIVGLVGDNGAGKSTLIKILSGADRPNAGTIYVEGEEVRLTSPRVAMELGIETIYQYTAMVPQMSIARNVFIGREPLTRWRIGGIGSQQFVIDPGHALRRQWWQAQFGEPPAQHARASAGALRRACGVRTGAGGGYDDGADQITGHGDGMNEIRVLVVDDDPSVTQHVQTMNVPVIRGDAADASVLEAAGGRQAKTPHGSPSTTGVSAPSIPRTNR